MYLTRSSHFPSFPQFRFAGKSSPAKNLDLISRGFDENLITRLKPLMFSGAKSPSISLSWLSLAVDLLLSTHNDAVALFSDLRSSNNLDDSLGLYLDDSIKLLDLCNSISSEIEQLQKGRLLINYVLHLLDFPDEATQIPSPDNLRRAKNSLSDWLNNSSPEFKKPNLSNAANLIRDLAPHLNNPPRGKISTVQKLIHHITYAVVAVTVLVTSTVVSALTGSPPGTIRVRIPETFFWSETFNGLESAMFSQIRNNEEKKKRRFIDDLDDVDRRVKSVCDVIDYLAGRDGFGGGGGVEEDEKRTLLNAVRELKAVAKKFSDGLDGLYDGVNVLFNTVLCTRNGVLEKFRSCK